MLKFILSMCHSSRDVRSQDSIENLEIQRFFISFHWAISTRLYKLVSWFLSF